MQTGTQQFNPPLDYSALQEFEQAHNIRLPQLFIDLHTTIDGRQNNSGTAQGWLSLDDIRALQEHWQDQLFEQYGDDWSSIRPQNHHPNAIQTVPYHPLWIPFLRISNVIWCIDYAPAAFGSRGQIIRVDTAPDASSSQLTLQAANFDDWFKHTANNKQIQQKIQKDLTKLIDRYKQQYYIAPFINAATTPYKNAIKAHIETHVGPIKAVFQENSSQHAIDILWTAAEEGKRHYHTLITCGLSARTNDEGKRLELLVLLPEDWPIGIAVFRDPRNVWPLHWLKTLAHLPEQNGISLSEGQTISNGENAALIEDTPYGGVLLFPPLITLPEAFAALNTDDGGQIHFCTLIPLTPQEIHYKNRYGLQALLRRFRRLPHTADILQSSRDSCVS